MRPVDLQTALPRVTEAARVEKSPQQGQDKAMADQAAQGRESARKGGEHVAGSPETRHEQVKLKKEGGGQSGRKNGQRQKGRSDPDAPPADEASHQASHPAPGTPLTVPPDPDAPGSHLDLRM